MSEKRLWSIDRVYLDPYESCSGDLPMRIQMDPIGTIVATKEEVDALLDLDWNKPSIRDPFAPGHIYRPVHATELNVDTLEAIKACMEAYRP